ncbi:glycosyltransferase family 2 protein [Candidatus Omnitrophota bacterium]
MKISILMPVYNERGTIEEIIRRVNEVDIDKEIIIVDDGSTDGTREILKSMESDKDLKIHYLEHNRGKGAAVREAIKHMSGDIAIVQDADLEYDPQAYHNLIEPIIKKEADAVYGSRFVNVHRWLFAWHWFANRFLGKHYEIKYLSHFLGIQLLNILCYLLYGTKITDEATCYKVFRSDVLRSVNLKCERFEFCPEVTAKVLKKGYKIAEVPITYHPRSDLSGKKIHWTDGFDAIFCLIKYRFVD